MSEIKDLGRRRSQFAYNCVNEAKDKSYSGDYKPYTKKIPMLVKTNGLGATIAFVKSKAKDKDNAYSCVYSNIEEWLKEIGILKNKDILLDKVINFDSSEYKRATIEVIAFSTWLGRFAEGLIEDKKTSSEGDDNNEESL